MAMENMITGDVETEDGARVSYMRFGVGSRRLVFIPGAGDGLADASGAARRLSWWMRDRARRFDVLYVSRRVGLTLDVSLERQADDVARVMEHLSFGPALVEAQSAGGSIGQLLAARRPDLAPALVLSSSSARLNDATRAMCARWLHLARARDWEGFFDATAPVFFPGPTGAMLRSFSGLLRDLITPEDPRRVEAILEQLIAFDHRELLTDLSVPVLISAGADDMIFPTSQQHEMNALIPRSTLILSPGFGHSHDLENPAHVDRVAAFARLHGVALRGATPHGHVA
jgi:pimeloyl-ACP methyl ester carboxylesterase